MEVQIHAQKQHFWNPVNLGGLCFQTWCRWDNTYLSNSFSVLEKLKNRLHKQDFHFILRRVMFCCTASTFFQWGSGKGKQVWGEDRVTNLTSQWFSWLPMCWMVWFHCQNSKDCSLNDPLFHAASSTGNLSFLPWQLSNRYYRNYDILLVKLGAPSLWSV